MPWALAHGQVGGGGGVWGHSPPEHFWKFRHPENVSDAF